MKEIKMMQLQFCKCLLLAAILVIGTEGSPECCVLIPSIPNLDAAMEGYDPILANPLAKHDRGIRSQIFEPMSELPDGRYVENSFIDKAREDLRCDAELSGKIFRNYNEYNKERFSSHEFSLNADVSVSARYGMFSFSASAGYSSQSTDEERNMQKFFQETNGEIIEKNAVCRTHTVSISLFEKPVFTVAFMTALRALHFAAKTPDSEESRQIYVKFAQSYGIHFMKTTYLGSKIIFRKSFASKSVDSQKQNFRSGCVGKSAYASLGVGLAIVEVGATFETASKECESADDSTSFFQNNGFNSEKVISIGSVPQGDLEKWANTVKESPVPIYYDLEKISILFQSEWFPSFTIDTADPNSENLNGTAMFNFFERMSASYCQLLLQRDCIVQTKGCGYNSLCSKDQTCVSDPSTDLGYTCNDMTHYGPVLIMGGWTGKRDSAGYLSRGDAIGTWTLPYLPYGVSGNSLSVVGSKIYSCGGGPFSGGSTSSCYALDRASSTPEWGSITSLPTVMSYHTAVTIKDHIWIVYYGNLYDLNTRTNKFNTFHLPLTVTNHHCAVSNDSHSFIIGEGSSHDEIWVNAEEYNPAKWHKVGKLRAGRRNFGCVWVEQLVVIAGGDPARSDAVVFDTITHAIRTAGALVQGRRGHRMMVLDGKPAVVGGWDGSAHFDSIETYDEKTGLWFTSEQKLIDERSYFGLVQLRG